MGAHRRHQRRGRRFQHPEECPAQSNYSINVSAVIQWTSGWKKVTSQLDFEVQRDFCQAGREDGRYSRCQDLGGHAWESMSFHKDQTGTAEFSVAGFTVNVVAAGDTGKIGQVHWWFLSRSVKGLALCLELEISLWFQVGWWTGNWRKLEER